MLDRIKDLFRRRGVATFVILAAIASAIITVIVARNLWLDDAFISFRYAKNLYEGQGLVYNAGERVEGYTNFLWTIIAYVGLQLGVEAITFAQIVSVVSQMLTIWLVYLLGQGPEQSRYSALIAPVFLAFHASFLAYPMTGMETSFFTMLVVLAVLLLIRNAHTSRTGAVALSAVLLGIAFTRFDGLIMVGILLGYKVLFEREFKKLLPIVGIFVVGVVIYNLWRISYYPALLPNTFYAKVGFSLVQVAKGGLYLVRFVVDNGPHFFLLAVLPFALGQVGKREKFFAWVVAAHLSYILLVGGDWMPFYRFIMPVLPLLFLLMQNGLWQLYELARPEKWGHRLAGAAVMMLLFAWNFLPLYENKRFLTDGVSGYLFHPKEARGIGAYLNDVLPGDYLVANEWAGIIPYYMQQPVLDIFGLTDSEITEMDFPRTTNGRFITADYLLERDPEVIILLARTFATVEKATSATQYRLMSGPEHSWARGFYSTLAGPHYPYKLAIMKMAEASYLPLLVREDIATQLPVGPEQTTFMQFEEATNGE